MAEGGALHLRGERTALVEQALAYENSLRSMSCLEAAIFEHGLPKGTASGLEVQARAEEADFKSSRCYRREKDFPE